MIKQIKNLMLVAVVAMGFVGCNDNINEAIRPMEPAMVEMTITADVDDTRTVLDENNGVVMWSDGDQLKVIENSATYRTTKAIAIDGQGKAQFTVEFPVKADATSFTYNAIYPASAVVEDATDKIDAAKVKVIVKDQQMATATSFDPAADILVSKHIETEAQPTELNMQFKRLVALGKLSLTNLPASSKIAQVTFTAGADDKVAGRNYVDATTGEVSEYSYYGKTNSVAIHYDEPITTRDIYFACNPFEMEAGEKFTIKVVCDDATYTREVEIPVGKSLTFVEGDLNTFTVNMQNASKEDNFVFADGDYAVLAVANGKYYALLCDAVDSRLASLDEYKYDGSGFVTLDDDTANMRWTIANTANGYTFKGANDCYIAWSSSNSAKTQADPYYLDIVKDEKNEGRYYVVSKADATRKLQRNKDVATYKYFAFYTSEQLGSLLLVPIGEDTTPRFKVGPKSLEFDSDGNSIDDDFFTVTAVNGFDITTVTATTDAEWLNIDYSEASDGIYYMCPDENDGNKRSADVVFSAEGLSVTVTVEQQASENAGDDDDSTITIAEFLELKDTATEYTLTGKITSVANTSYGNFNLTDATGTVYVYGLLTPEGESQKQWAAAGLKQGDVITIKGKYDVYKDAPQVKNAVYVSHKGIYVDNSTLQFTAEGGSLDITATLVNSTDAISVSVDNSHFSVALKSGTTYTITAPANETEESIYANLTFTAGELSAVVSIAQEAKAAEGVAVGGRDDFDTVKADSSYGARKTTDGWNGTNCAVMQGGTSDSNPTFKFIGSTSATRAFTMNGKTSAKGNITSPTLTTGCGELSLKYGNAFSESNGVDFTVTIKQNGTAVKTYRIDENTISQKTAYTWEQEVNIAGEFVIEITNNSPSNSSSNKDRVSIWDIVWTGYGN